MRNFTKSLLLFLTVSISQIVFAQNSFFSDQGANRVMATSGERVLFPVSYRTYTADVVQLKTFLWSLPKENQVNYNRNLAPVLHIPMPDGSLARFRVWESSIQEPGLEAKFPEIKTFLGQGIDDPYATIRFDYNPYFGFSAQILSPKGRVMVDPFARGDIHSYISYFRKDHPRLNDFSCPVNDRLDQENVPEAGPCLGTTLRTYRLAFSCTGEFAQAVGGGVAGPVHAAIVTGINRVTQVYENELSVRLLLIADNNLVEFLNAGTDPWANNGSIAELNSITGQLNTFIGAANYDIGHLGCTASNAGVAFLGVVCGPNKGGGLTGGLNPVGDPYYIDYVAHEMGHQFSAQHTFNSNQCASPGGSYEPGGGTTIMAYAGICAASENLQPFSDDIFHALSFDQIGTFISTGGGSSCAATAPTGNNLPTITAMNDNGISVPINTPFVLTATATDPDGDAITYNWEGWDVGAAGSWPSAANSTTRPLFRTRPSLPIGERTFPDIRVIAANYPGTGAPSAMNGLRGEVLPLVERPMKFRLTVRDNRAGGGGVVSGGSGCELTSTFQVNAVGATPFSVTVPNGGETYPGGSTQTITWNNANTTSAPFNVADVKITLSTDGGLTYPNVVIASTPNDGSESVTIPAVPATSTARIRVEAIGNIFFDISNANFNVTVPPNGFTFTTPPPATSACPAPASMAITLGVVQVGTFNGPVTLSATGNPPGTTVNFSVNPVTVGNTTVVTLNGTNTLSFGSYTITVTGTSPGFPNATRDLTYTINPGAAPTITTQPASQTVCANAAVNFSVTATGATGYQWQISTPAVPAFNNIPGATAATYAIPVATAGMNGNQYRVILTSQCGTVTSNAATLTVNTAPAIGTQPQNATICTGNNNTFSVTATGTNLTYQWELNTGSGYNPIAGATSSSYTVNNATLAMNGYSYRVVITGVCPPSATSNAAVLTVVQAPAISAQPVDASVCVPPNANTGFNVTATGATIYQWEVSTNGGGTWTPVSNGGIYSGATSASLLINGADITMNGFRYRVQVSNASCPAVTSNPATLTVNQVPSISGQPQNATICAGTNNTFTVNASGSNLVYQWQVSTPAVPAFTNIPGANSSSYSVIAATIAMNTNQYRVVITGTCSPSVTSAPAVLNVIAAPAISTQPANNAVCETGTIGFGVTATNTTQYQWQVSTNGGSSWTDLSGETAATLNLTNVSMSMNGYMYRVLLRNATCTSPVISTAATLTVNNRPTVTLSASPTALLPGRSTTITATLNPASTAFNITWKRNNVIIPGANTNTYVVNVTRLGNYQVDIIDPVTGCNNTSNILSIRDSASTKLFVFPSPNTGRFTVSYHNPPGTPTHQTLAIYNSKGEKVYHRKLAVNGAYELHDIDLTKAAGGVYYVVIGDPAGKVLADAKVMIQH